MTPHVMKRDGCKVPFKSERIKEAITGLFISFPTTSRNPDPGYPQFTLCRVNRCCSNCSQLIQH
ncbi:hypothetical protein, partial [Salmonella enterica]|uniref:hypothetical protein n=1 Tax=Salmonella enterica TaxID=28901 RepID=UPI00164BEC91